MIIKIILFFKKFFFSISSDSLYNEIKVGLEEEEYEKSEFEKNRQALNKLAYWLLTVITTKKGNNLYNQSNLDENLDYISWCLLSGIKLKVPSITDSLYHEYELENEKLSKEYDELLEREPKVKRELEYYKDEFDKAVLQAELKKTKESNSNLISGVMISNPSNTLNLIYNSEYEPEVEYKPEISDRLIVLDIEYVKQLYQWSVNDLLYIQNRKNTIDEKIKKNRFTITNLSWKHTVYYERILTPTNIPLKSFLSEEELISLLSPIATHIREYLCTGYEFDLEYLTVIKPLLLETQSFLQELENINIKNAELAKAEKERAEKLATQLEQERLTQEQIEKDLEIELARQHKENMKNSIIDAQKSTVVDSTEYVKKLRSQLGVISNI